MKRFGAQFNKKAQSIRLTATERKDLRARVTAYMEYHPLPKDVKSTVPPQLTLAESYKMVRVSYAYMGSFIGVLTMLVLVVVPVVAEKAVPGDTLYPVKVQFNEEIRSTLALSPYAKMEWETKRLERRLAEARLLADEGRLTEAIEAEVVLAVQAHSNAAKQEIAAMRATDNDEATIAEITFASALEVQSEVLESRRTQAAGAGHSVVGLAGVIAEARSDVLATSQETANVSYEKLLARLEMETTHAQELFTSIQASASEDDVTDIGRRFADIKRKIDDSIALYEHAMQTATTTATATQSTSVQATEAKHLLKIALVDTRKLISFMTDIDVRTNVSIEELVPMTRTDEENEAFLLQRLDILLTQKETIESLEPFEGVRGKFELGQEKFLNTLESAAAALDDDEYKTAEKLLTDAETIVIDLIKMGMTAPLVDTETSTTTVVEGTELTPEENRSSSSATSSQATEEEEE